MAQRRYNTDASVNQMQSLRAETHQKASALSADMRSFFQDCEGYFLTSGPAQPAIYQELSKLVDRLQVAELRQISAEEVLGMSGEDYCKLTLRRLNIERYDFNLAKYVPAVLSFVVLTLTIYATYMFIAGYAWWGDFSSDLQMPVAVSILGLPLQVFVIFTAIFFWVTFQRNTAFGRKWYQGFNTLYLLAGIFSAALVFTLPYIIHSYRVAQINLPVWLVWAIAIIAMGYYFLVSYFNVGDKVDLWISNRAAQSTLSDDDTYSPTLGAYLTGQPGNDDKDLTPVRELDQTPDSNNEEKPAVSDEPMRLNNLWNTIMLKRPIINRKTYREMQDRQERDGYSDKTDKDDKKYSESGKTSQRRKK